MKSCFVIMPFSDPSPYSQDHFRTVYAKLIKPACVLANFQPTRADSVSSSNLIMLEVIRKVLSADLVLCDLSSANPNVLYELGVRHAAQRPVVLAADERTPEIFDVSASRITRYSTSNLENAVNPDLSELAKAITETAAAPVESFFSLDRNLEHLLARIRVYAKRTDLTGDQGLKDALSTASHLDIVGLAAEAAIVVFREDLRAALSRPGFTARFVIFDPAVDAEQSTHYDALVQTTLQQTPALKRSQANEVLKLANQVSAVSGNSEKMQVRVIRGRPLLYNLWLAGPSADSPSVGHVSIYFYDQSRGGPAFRTVAADSSLMPSLVSEFEYVWNNIAVSPA